MGQEAVLRLQAGEGPGLQRVVLHILHAGLDLPFVPRHVRLGRQDHRAVVPAERLELGNQLGIEPVGMLHRRLEIVDDQRLGNAAEVREGVLQAADEVLRRLGERRLAIRLAA